LDAKFIIDTASTKTLISSRKAEQYYKNYISNERFHIQSAHQISSHDHVATIPLPRIFNDEMWHKFYIFDFNPKYDGLIGIDLLLQLDAQIDLKNRILKTRTKQIPIRFTGNPNKKMSATHLTQISVEPRTQKVVKLPVDKDVEQGIINYTKIAEGVEIAASLVSVQNKVATTVITNSREEAVIINFQKPINIEEMALEELYISTDPTEDNIIDLDKGELQKINLDKLRLSHLNGEEKQAVQQLCFEFKDIFHCEGIPLTFTNTVKHQINTADNIPIYSRPYRQPYAQKEELRRQISSMLEQGIIQPSSSPWSSPVHLVPKKMDASGTRKWRMVIDYRKLNEKTVDDKYPLPQITEILDKLGRSQYFTTLDLCSGYHQIEMNSNDIQKTAFTTEQGHYEFTRMPFGLKNAPSTFQRVMDNVLRGIQNEKCAVYLDDIVVFSTSLQEHLERLRQVFERIRKTNLKIQLDKCEFLKKEVAYLGHVITASGVKPNPDKIKAVINYPIPKTQKEIKQFLGLIGYYRRFIRDFAKLTKPLTQCLKKGAKVDLTAEYIDAFEKCKHVLTNHPILQYPDFNKPFLLTTDASNVGISAILSQGPVGSDKPIAFASRTLSNTERRYSTIEKELLAIVFGTKYFRPYLYGQKFAIYTDHRPLIWLDGLKEPNAKLMRWKIKLQEFDYKIIHKKGKANTNADALSRIELNTLDNETSSMIANISEEEIQEVLDDLIREGREGAPPLELQNEITDLEAPESSGNTAHSQPDEPAVAIPILNEAVDNKPTQILVTTIFNRKTAVKVSKEENRDIIRATIPKNNNHEEILNFLRDYTTNSKKYYIHFDKEQMYKDFSNVYTTHFTNQGPKLIRCTNRLITVLEPEEQQTLTEQYHVSKINHRGISETLKHIQRKYYWKNMKDTVTNYIKNCEICQRTKYERNPAYVPMMLTDTADKPFQKIHVDTFTIDGANFVTIVCAFSKLGQAIYVTSKNATEITNAFLQYFSFYGTPTEIVMDNGTEFHNDTVQQCLNLHHIKIHFTTPNNHESQGAIERLHSTLIEHIRLLKAKHKDPIQVLMRYAIIAYNNSIHSATGFTPLELTLGHTHARSPFDAFYDKEFFQNYVETHKGKLEDTYERVKTKLIANKETIHKNRNKEGENQDTFAIGHTVYKRKTSGNRNKTTEKFIGPYKITHIYPNNTAEITRNDKKERIHLRLLRRPIVTDGASTSAQP